MATGAPTKEPGGTRTPWISLFLPYPMGNVWTALIKIKMAVSRFSNLLLSIKPLSWQRVLEGPRIIKGLFNKISLIIYDDLNKERCIAIHLVVKHILWMIRKSGPLACALYYKQARTSLMMAYGSDSRVVPSNMFPISLTRDGFPRVIPSFHRKMIYTRDERAGQV